MAISNFFNRFIGIKNEIPIDEAITRVNQEAFYTDGVERKPLWGGFGRNQFSFIHPKLQKAVSLFEKESVQNKTALDLGCGNAASAIHLLKKGWDVTAVDFSQEALDAFKEIANQINPNWINSGQLTLLCQDLETFQFPQNVTLIVASCSFPYLNPAKMKGIWDKIHTSLAPGGRLVGNFFPRKLFSQLDRFQRAIMGAWFTDLATVRALLRDKNYEAEILHCDTIFKSTRYIEFVAKKVSQARSTTPLIPLNLSSYFDAIRGLPSKGRFSHSYPFLTDRLIELREASKVTVLGSGAVAMAQSYLGWDTTIASYAFVASIGAWFFLKKCTQIMELRAQAHIAQLRSIDYPNSSELSAERQKIQLIQGIEEVKRLFNPPPPVDEGVFLSQHGIELIGRISEDSSQEEIGAFVAEKELRISIMKKVIPGIMEPS